MKFIPVNTISCRPKALSSDPTIGVKTFVVLTVFVIRATVLRLGKRLFFHVCVDWLILNSNDWICISKSKQKPSFGVMKKRPFSLSVIAQNGGRRLEKKPTA